MKTEISLPSRVFQLKVSIQGSKPEIWRRIRIPGKIRLHDLHLVIQAAIGWHNSQPYTFSIQGTDYRLPDPDGDEFADFENSRKTRLGELLLAEKMSFTYTYDMSDDWEHLVLIEKIEKLPLPPPSCLTGERACPPEDVGGISAYLEKLQILQNKKHPAYKETVASFGKQFDPDAFDLKACNEAVREYKAMEVDL